jgi:hypothetical protein
MRRTFSLFALLPLAALFGCGGATSATAPPSPDAGADLTSTACTISVGPSGKSFESSAARIYIGGAENPFPHFECGDPSKGDPYLVLVTMAPDNADSTAGVSLYPSSSPTAMSVGGGESCAIAISSDGTPLTTKDLMSAKAGSVVTAKLGSCALPSYVTLTNGWIRAVLDAAK